MTGQASAPALTRRQRTGDVNAISIGANTNIQDGTVVHVARHNPKGQQAPTTIGDNVTIGPWHALSNNLSVFALGT